MIRLTTLLCFMGSVCLAQNWYKENTLDTSGNTTDPIFRQGPVLISDYYTSPYNNGFGVVSRYNANNNNGISVSLNEPDSWLNSDGDSTRVGLALNNSSTHTALMANNFANFYDTVNGTDVHNSTSEFNYVRGMPNRLGFRDGGRIKKAAVLKLGGTFGNNGRRYSNEEFDLLNLRFFTGNTGGNLAEIDRFYGIRLEYFRGTNTSMIENGWGIYIQPSFLKNYFAGHVGIGVSDPTHTLTVSATSNPVRFEGIQGASDFDLLTIDSTGEVHRKNEQSMNGNFQVVHSDISPDEDSYLYIHKGGNATYILPSPGSRIGKTWKIVNVGSGIITFTEPYKEGDEMRYQLLNKAGNYSIELFSDGTNYIALQ